MRYIVLILVLGLALQGTGQGSIMPTESKIVNPKFSLNHLFQTWASTRSNKPQFKVDSTAFHMLTKDGTIAIPGKFSLKEGGVQLLR